MTTETPTRYVSERARAMLATIMAHYELHGYAPSIRELCTLMGIRSTSTIHYHLVNLELAGYIQRPAGANRAIRILRTAIEHGKRCPTCGTMVSDMPIPAPPPEARPLIDVFADDEELR